MTMQQRHQAFAQPPPFETDLVDADRVVGWINGNVIGFQGFGDETEATHAAWIAHRTLARRIARTHGMRLVPIDIEPLALRRSDGDTKDVILASNRPIATLVKPGGQSKATDSYAFELAVPSPMTELELRGVAYLIYRTLRKSGVRWALWRTHRPARVSEVIERESVVAGKAGEATRGPRGPVWNFPAWKLAARATRWLGNQLRLTPDAKRRIIRAAWLKRSVTLTVRVARNIVASTNGHTLFQRTSRGDRRQRSGATHLAV